LILKSKAFYNLLAIAQELSSEFTLNDLYQKIIAKAQTFMNADRSLFFFVNKNEKCLLSMVAQGTSE
jgi:hypothetical protein